MLPKFPTRNLVACFVLMGLSNTAVAGNLTDPVVEPQIEVIREDRSLRWEGAYVGATLGYNFSGGDRIGVTTGSGSQFNLGDFDNSGWSGSLRAGYRWQLDRWVFGPELAIEGGQVEDSFTSGGYSGATKLNHALSLRMKAGMTVPVFNSIVYGTVGITRGEFDYSVTGSGNRGAVAVNETFASNGYILGVGIEQPLTDRLSLTGEYEYINYGKDTLTDGLGNTTVATPLFHSLKVGLNLRF